MKNVESDQDSDSSIIETSVFNQDENDEEVKVPPLTL